MSALTNAVRCLAASLQSLAAETGKYCRDPSGVLFVELRGTPVVNEYEVIDDESGLTTKVLYHDWIFRAADLVLPGEFVAMLPRKGDRWKPTINGVEEIYEVLPVDKRPCFERHDPAGVLLLVHTKKVAA